MKRYRFIQSVTLSFFVGIISGILIHHKWNYLPRKEMLLAIPTLLAAFGGAWFAFKFEDDRRRKDQKKKNISACNKNIYILSKQYDVLLELQIKIIEPVRNSLESWREMEPVPYMDYKDLKLNIEDILFFQDTSHKDILYRLLEAEKKFHGTIDTFNKRSQFFLEEVQPRLLDKTAIACSNKDDYKQLKDKIVDLTDKTILFVDGAVEFIEEIQYDLIKAIKDIYPEANPISFEQIE
jgi:hypothetical protein